MPRLAEAIGNLQPGDRTARPTAGIPAHGRIRTGPPHGTGPDPRRHSLSLPDPLEPSRPLLLQRRGNGIGRNPLPAWILLHGTARACQFPRKMWYTSHHGSRRRGRRQQAL